MRGIAMKTTLAAGAFGLLLSAQAMAADYPVKAKAPPPPPAPAFDVAIGGVVWSDYNFRGVSQTNRGPSGGAYFEAQFNTGATGTWYAGLAAWGVDWPTAFGFTSPSAEIDLYGGWRNTWDKFSLDLGYIYYWYPREIFNGFTSDSDFMEFYAKAAYAFTPDFTLGFNIFYTPDLLHYSASFRTMGINANADAVYASLTAKWVTPWKSGDWGSYLSGELGHWWIDNRGFISAAAIAAGLPGVDPSYTYGNAGLALTYKAITIDFRYHGNSMSNAQCASFLVTAVGNPSNRWCGDTFIVALKFDTSLAALK
jgi:uncharacterized protein (TIGR02001 family)